MAGMSRRGFLKLTAGGGGAIAAGLGLKKFGKLIPYVIQPEDIRPGTWSTYATTCRECPAGCGMHVRVIDGRVVKCEGNPNHPVSHGGLCARGQSAPQGLYDPDRIKGPLIRNGKEFVPATWDEAIKKVAKRLGQGGTPLLISDLQTGTLSEVMAQFATTFKCKYLTYEPFNYETLLIGPFSGIENNIPLYHLDKADLIISFAADFLETWISPVEFAHQFAQMRQVRDGKMGRFIYVGPRMSMTAANADRFFQVSPAALPWIAKAVSIKSRARYSGSDETSGLNKDELSELAIAMKGASGYEKVISAVVEAMIAAREPVMLPGFALGWEAQCRVVDQSFSAPLDGGITPYQLTQANERREIVSALDQLGAKDMVIVHNSNPVFTISGAVQRVRRAGLVVYLGTLLDETAELADIILPIDSPLEQWGDYGVGRVFGVMQPTMRRLHDTRLPGDVLLSIATAAGKTLSSRQGGSPTDFQHWLRASWDELLTWVSTQRGPSKTEMDRATADERWAAALRSGVFVFPPPEAHVGGESGPPSDTTPAPALTSEPSPQEAWLWAYPSIMWFDGRTANRGWLQEAPDPMSYATWGSWIDMHPEKAKALGLDSRVGAQLGQVVQLKSDVGMIEAPVRVTEDVAPDTVAIALGQGHTAAGLRTACGVGANPFMLIAPGLPGPTKVTIIPTGKSAPPVYTSPTQSQHGRDLLQWVSLAKVNEQPTEKFRLPLPSDYDKQHNIFDPHQKYARRWAMVIDLHRCIGCGACAVACYAENNISVMGAKWVREGREMAWLKVVPYREKEEGGKLGWLPMLCQQCDSAPCEPVCPVFASVHNFEGLNAQVYNRCIGTRYCNNNCPYKVRRFNWFDTHWEKPLDWQLNPDVTVRCRGVMEKCNFCIQRIRAVEIQAKEEGRAVRDEEVRLLPACAMSCPTRAIKLGDLMDQSSEVYKLTTTDPRRYHVLEELNTKPAVTYLKRIKVDE